MGRKILSVLNKENFHCLPCEQVNLDFERFVEYQDSDEHPAEAIFENPVPNSSKRKCDEIIGSTTPTILRYFLDGSRRTYKIADIIDQKRYLPLIAGQVGVAVVHRRHDDRGVEPMRDYCRFENILAFPDESVSREDLDYLQAKINKESRIQFTLIKYRVKKDKDPVDLAVAAIMRRMQDLEVEAVAALSKDNRLDNDAMLIIDGPLRFREMSGRPFDIVQFRNVVGLSKNFRPSFSIGKGRKQEDVGSITSSLDFGERTPVYKTVDGKLTIGMWYLRMRNPEMMTNPLQGIVKLECYAIAPEEQEIGLEADRIDGISGHILRERNVTPYKTDSRWASHIYPVYLAETYLKTSFMSDVCFKALF